MAKVCHSCGKGPAFGQSRSHSMVATKRRFDPNLQKVRILVGALQAVQLREHRAQRQRHVVARVAVGDGEHVEVVDLLTTRFQMCQRARHGNAKTEQIGIRHADSPITFARTYAGPRGQTYGQSAFVTLPAFRHRVQT